MVQRTRDLNNISTTEKHDCFPFPIEPLQFISSTKKPKRSIMHSSDSGITSAFASSRTPVLSPASPTEASTPQTVSSPQAQLIIFVAPERLSPIQQFIRNSATRMAKSNVKSHFHRAQIRPPAARLPQSSISIENPNPTGLLTLTSFITLQRSIIFILHAPLFLIRSDCFEHYGYDSPMRTIQLTLCLLIQTPTLYFLRIFTTRYKRAKNNFICCATSKKKATQ